MAFGGFLKTVLCNGSTFLFVVQIVIDLGKQILFTLKVDIILTCYVAVIKVCLIVCE